MILEVAVGGNNKPGTFSIGLFDTGNVVFGTRWVVDSSNVEGRGRYKSDFHQERVGVVTEEW